MREKHATSCSCSGHRRWDSALRFMVEQVAVHYMKFTLPRACRNFIYPTWHPLLVHAQFLHCYGPFGPDTDGDSNVSCSGPHNPHSARLWLTPTVHTLDEVVSDPQQCFQDAVRVTPLWEHTTWFSRTRRLCQEYHVLKPTQQREAL